LSNELIEVKVI